MDIIDRGFIAGTVAGQMSLNRPDATNRSRIIHTLRRSVVILFSMIMFVSFLLLPYIFITWDDPYGINTFQKVIMPVIILVTFSLGWLIDKKHPGHTIALLFLIMAYALMWGPITLVAHWLNETLPGQFYYEIDSLTKTISEISWIPGVFIPLFFMPLYFPTGKLLSRRWWLPVIIFAGFMLWYFVSIIFRPWPWPDNDMSLTRTLNGIAGTETFFDSVQSILNLIAGPVFLAIPLSMVLRYRRAGPDERIQMKWPMTSAGVLFISLTVSMLFPNWASFDAEYGYPLTWTLAMLLPVSIGIGILRHRLFDIDVFISRALVYGILTLMIVGFYIVVVSGFGALFQSRTTTLNGLIATGVAAVMFQPLRERLQRIVNRILYGERADPAAILTRLAHHMETADTSIDILPNLMQTIAHTLKIPYVAIWLADDDDPKPLASWGKSANNLQTIPLIYKNENIGHLGVSQRRPHEPFSRYEEQLLPPIAALTATTVRAVQLSDELRQSRQRIVTAREEERRRIRRDLHDGLGPQLASQTLGLEAVAQLMPNNPAKAQALLQSLKAQAHEAILDVRRLVYDLRPPALDDLGLLGALQQSASRYETGALRFSFDVCNPLPALPAAVETAIFRIAQEAMTNVVRHADATLCVIRIYASNGHMVIEVRDNGRGITEAACSGVGLQAMQERAAELNGQHRVEAIAEGGTQVEARLPLEFYRE